VLTVVVTSGVEVVKVEELVTMVVVDSKDKFTIEVIASLVTIGDIGDALVLAAADVASGVEVDKVEELVTMVVVDSKDKSTIEDIVSLVTIGDIGDALVLAAAGVVVISCEFDDVAPHVEIFSPVEAISEFITK
jgi:predicted short-subunit dehydrogenase-like oxidoreductase (DUF2520 family)